MLDFIKTFTVGFITIAIFVIILYLIDKIPGVDVLCLFIPLIILLVFLSLVVGYIVLAFISAIREK